MLAVACCTVCRGVMLNLGVSTVSYIRTESLLLLTAHMIAQLKTMHRISRKYNIYIFVEIPLRGTADPIRFIFFKAKSLDYTIG